MAADNIAKGGVLDTPGQETTELRLQLVASPEDLPKTLYNPDDTCASAWGCEHSTFQQLPPTWLSGHGLGVIFA